MKVDLLLAFWTQYFYLLNRLAFPLPSCVPEFPSSIDDPIFNQYWSEVKKYTLLDVYRAKSIWNLAQETKHLDGDFIECGSYQGGLSFLLAFFVRHFALKKRVFLCDSFQGLPEPDPKKDQLFTKGLLPSDQETCQKFISKQGLEEIAIIKAGWFENTLATFPKEQKFSLIHIDCDLYQSTLTCLEQLHPRAVLNAPIIFDDFICYSSGERMAAKEWLVKMADSLELGPFSQVYFRKGVEHTDPKNVISDPEGHPLSCRDIAQNKDYHRFLDRVISHYQLQISNLSSLSHVIFKEDL